jgi:CheY-like chemotaxis protein
MEKSNVSVLVVDDNKINRDLLSRRLVNEEYIVHVASSGMDALKLLEVEKFDIILLDIRMPGMDGYEVLAWIKNNPVHTETPVIMLTASNERESVVKSIEMGAADYMVKPYDMAVIKTRIWKYVHSTELQQKFDKTIDMNEANILVVDDDEMNRDILCHRVESFGCKVDVAENGIQALEMIDGNNRYHLVLLDINMPEMSGIDVLRHIKVNPVTAETAVIMVSANDNEELLRECITQGAIDYINKPYNAVVLRARVVPVIHSVLLNEIEKSREARLKKLDLDGSQFRVK